MTTIVVDYENRVIAWDSRATTRSGVIVSDKTKKKFEVDGVNFWMSGAHCDKALLVEMYFGKKSDLIPECDGFALDSGVMYFICSNSDAKLCKEIVEQNLATGSGRDWALAALDHGKSAKEAVEYAKTRDCYTGGEFHTLEF